MPTPEVHAFLSPSSAHRWLVCTPSAYLEAQEPFVDSTIYAKEGTEAHALAELKLSYMLGKINDEQYVARFQEFKLTSEYYNEEFNDYVNDYCQEVMTIVKEDYKDQDVKVYLEERVDFNDIVPRGSGTSDVVIVGKHFIHIVDLKFGKGVQVNAIGNPQLRLYTLGAIRTHLRECQCTETKQTIIQPRLGHIETDFMSVEELNKWANDVVKPAAAKAIAGKGELVAGDHCKFCKLRGKCQALADKQLAQAQSEFTEAIIEDKALEPSQMSPEVLARILEIGPKFCDWFKDVKAYAEKAAIVEGVKIPGYKIVEGRSVRTILNTSAVEEKLKTAGFSETEYLKPRELLGITSLEKNVGKKLFSTLCEDYIVKPKGHLTLVPESDKRPSVNSIKLTGNEFLIETDEE